MEGKMRKAGMAVLGTGAVILLVVGCSPRSPFEGDHAWSSWKRHHGLHGKNFPELVLRHMDKRVEELNLTESQKGRYAAIREKAKQELIGGQARRRDLASSIRKEMHKELPDIHEVAGMVSEHMEMVPGAMDRFMNLFLEFYEILDENQKAEVIEHFRDRLNRIPFKETAESVGGSIESGRGFSLSFTEQMAQKRGDRNGELL